MLDRDVVIRNHVMGVLVDYSARGLKYSNFGELADAITQAVIEGERKWHEDMCVHQLTEMTQVLEDVQQ